MPPGRKAWHHPLAYLGQIDTTIYSAWMDDPAWLRASEDQSGIMANTLLKTHLSHKGPALLVKPIFNSHGSTTGGQWRYIKTPLISVLMRPHTAQASPSSFLPIDSHPVGNKSPTSQTWPAISSVVKQLCCYGMWMWHLREGHLFPRPWVYTHVHKRTHRDTHTHRQW